MNTLEQHPPKVRAVRHGAPGVTEKKRGHREGGQKEEEGDEVSSDSSFSMPSTRSVPAESTMLTYGCYEV